MRFILLLLVVVLSGCSSHVSQPENTRRIDTRVDLALAYLNNGNVERALFHLQRAALISSSNLRYQLALTYYYELTHQSEKARNSYRHLSNLYKHNPNVLNNFAQYQCRAKRYTDAAQLFQQAIQNADGTLEGSIYKNAALCSLQNQDYKTAMLQLEKARYYQPNNPDITALIHQLSEGKRLTTGITTRAHASF